MPARKHFEATRAIYLRVGPIHPTRMDTVLNGIRWSRQPAVRAAVTLIQDQAAYIMSLESEILELMDEDERGDGAAAIKV